MKAFLLISLVLFSSLCRTAVIQAVAVSNEDRNDEVLESHTTSRDPEAIEGDSCSSLCGNASCATTDEIGPVCTCRQGYQFDASSKACVDIDECERNSEICGTATCENRIGSYMCTCPEGYIYKRKRKTCADFNECKKYRALCGNGRCVNKKGAFACVCSPGQHFSYSSHRCVASTRRDVCSRNPGICGNAICSPLGHSIRCLCPAGYDYDPSVKGCKNIDLCVDLAHLCGNGTCVNQGQNFICICPDGFEFSNTKVCIDLNECSTASHSCGLEASCVNTHGSHHCACSDGFEFNPTTRTCDDIDECERNSEICGTATCENRIGGYVCTCPEGYIYENKTCADFDECKKYRTLCGNGRCVNKKGTFACVCFPGQHFSYSSHRCVASTSRDVCSRNPGICGNATCSSLGHSIRCLCPAGYDFDPSVKGCKIISECDLPNRCGEGALCEDTMAGYRCVCTEGYIYNYQDRSCREMPPPQELALEASGGQEYHPSLIQTTAPPRRAPNECSFSPCINGVCIDRPDGFICQCVEGYRQVDSVTCEDINECEGPDAHNMCMYGNCVNEPPGSYTCKCTNGLILDSTGRRCIELIGPVSGGDGTVLQEEPLGPCWGQPGPNEDICSNVVSQESTYQQCCCNTGFSWGTECYSCPLRHSDEYRMLCVALSSFYNQDGGINQQVADQPGIPRS